MARLVIFKTSDKPRDEIVSRIDKYLAQALEAVRPFDQVATYSWNTHHNRVTIHGKRFVAEVVLVPKGVVVTAEIPVIWYPFKRGIEERIAHAMDIILGVGNGKEG